MMAIRLRRLVLVLLVAASLAGCAPLRHADPFSYQLPPPDCELLGPKYGYSEAQALQKQWYACEDAPRMIEQTVWLGETRRTTVWESDRGRFRSASNIWCPTRVPGPGERKRCAQWYGSDYVKVDGSILDEMIRNGTFERYHRYPYVFHPDEQRAFRWTWVEGACRVNNMAGC